MTGLSPNAHPSILAFEALDPEGRREALVRLAALALDVWRQYAAAHPGLNYRDSVVGESHLVDPELPARAVRAVDDPAGAAAVAEAYLEPIAALQDMDLEFPEPVEYAYHALYNLFRRYGRGEDIDEFLVLRQILSSLVDEERMAEALRNWP